MKKQAVISIVGVVAVALLSFSLLWRLMVQGESLGQLGLIGVFIASMLSHLTVVARDMFIPLFLPLASVYHPIILGSAAGTGAAIGEVTTYFLGWGVAESIEEMSDSEDKIAKWINKYGLWAVLLVALTPLPDTPIIILAGSRKLPFQKLLAIEVMGKSALYSVAAVVGGMVYTGLENTLGTVIASGLIVLGSLIFCVAVTWKPSRDWIFGWMEKLIPQINS
ncbi:MAG: VTT domain-containing protein [Candidatus Bathyarchaeota archaeon]|nr:VTT domain-containing protein [Candidatus Bathyarchaeota archaeon]